MWLHVALPQSLVQLASALRLFCSSPQQPVGRMSILPTRSGYQKKPEMGVRRVEFCGQGNVEFEGVLSMLGGLVSKEMEDTPSAERK